MPSANVVQTSVSGGQQNALALQGDGVFLPKLSTATRTALTLGTSDKGFLAYDTTDNNVYIWNGAAWESVPASGDSSNTQVIFNDNGTLAGDAGLTYDKATDSLTIQGSLAGVLRLVNINNFSTDPAAVTRLSLDGQGATWHLDNERTNGIFKITRNSTACLTIDNSANVGIGVQPSAWNNTYNVLDIGQNGSISGRTSTNNSVDIVSNGFRNAGGTWVYKLATSNAASRYLIDGSTGGHLWYSGAAGTAGNTIAGFSTATMTLDASGRLILLASTTTPATLNNNGQLTFTATSDTNLRFSYRGSDGVTRVANLTLA